MLTTAIAAGYLQLSMKSMAYKQIFPNSLKIKNGMKTLYSLVERTDPVSKQERGANNKNAKEYFTEPNPMFAGNALVGLCWGLAVARWLEATCGSYVSVGIVTCLLLLECGN